MEKATYAQLKDAYTKANGHMAFILAMTALLQLGSNKLENMCLKDIADTFQGNLFNQDIKMQAAEIALLASHADTDVLLAFIQREVPLFEDKRGDRIPTLHDDGDEEDICPVCGSEFEPNGDMDSDGNGGLTMTWHCPHCGASGSSDYDGRFLNHRDVIDEDGTPIDGRLN